MNTETILILDRRIKNISYDLISLSVITLIPALSHMIKLPLYLLEPMRIMLLISLFHTSKNNAFILSFMLPFFSLSISNHPSFLKTLLISSELFLNVYLFYYLSTKIKNYFALMFISILISKIYYYGVKFALLTLGFLDGEFVSTPVYLQFLVAVLLSVYSYIIMRNSNKILPEKIIQ